MRLIEVASIREYIASCLEQMSLTISGVSCVRDTETADMSHFIPC